jgi:hypothetical protein
MLITASHRLLFLLTLVLLSLENITSCCALGLPIVPLTFPTIDFLDVRLADTFLSHAKSTVDKRACSFTMMGCSQQSMLISRSQ